MREFCMIAEIGRWHLAVSCGLCLLTAAPVVHAASGNTVVNTEAGAVQGVTQRAVVSFKGIPYAAPPVGPLRWREPQPAPPWSGTRPANAFGKSCMQRPGVPVEEGGASGALSEDCLTLNVWTPAPTPPAKRPVIVWIHGGGYAQGAGSAPFYDGAAMARKGAVFVTFNYRLGPLGFFAHPALDAGNPGGPYNFGMLDQVAALKWIQANIAGFGGDPANVTIMGESAGGKSVLWHFASPLSRGLFHKGIAQSVYILPDTPLDKAREASNRIASAVGLDGAQASLAEMRKIAPERFFGITDKQALLGPVGIVGDTMLPRPIAETFQAGEEARLPLIIGNTSDDASVLSAFGLSPDGILDRLGAAGFALKLLYPGVPAEQIPRQALRDAVFTLNSRWTADRHTQRAPTWRYYFDYVAAKDKAKWPHGVPHGAEIVYFLDTLDSRYAQRDRDYAREVSGYMLAFARTGKPAFAASPEWQDHRRLRDRALIFGPDTIEQRNNFMKARLNALMGTTKIVDTLFRSAN